MSVKINHKKLEKLSNEHKILTETLKSHQEKCAYFYNLIDETKYQIRQKLREIEKELGMRD